jgi:hypothetical protein
VWLRGVDNNIYIYIYIYIYGFSIYINHVDDFVADLVIWKLSREADSRGLHAYISDAWIRGGQQ